MSLKIDVTLPDNTHVLNAETIEVEKGRRFQVRSDVAVSWSSTLGVWLAVNTQELRKNNEVWADENGILTANVGMNLRKRVHIIVKETKLAA